MVLVEMSPNLAGFWFRSYHLVTLSSRRPSARRTSGSANTLYQDILKLRREIPEARHPVAVIPPADLP